jgi:hypothetical protein
MNSQVNMCMSNSHLSREQQLIVIIIFMVVFGALYFYNIENIMNNPVFLENKEKEKKEDEEEEEEKNWEIYFKKDKHKKKDVNKWYILPGHRISRYKGEWKDGLAHGKGIREVFGCSEHEHTIFEGTFIEGKFTGYGKQTFDITRDEEEFEPYYEGEFKDHKQHGIGTYYYGNGSYRRGNLVDGSFQGKGIYYDHVTNRTWVGNHVNDKRGDGEWFDGEIDLKETIEDNVTENVQVKMR